MVAIDSLLAELDERTLAQRVGLRHDEARMAYSLQRNTVPDFDEFAAVIAHYYNYHFTRCISGGGTLPRDKAEGRAKAAVEGAYRRQNGSILNAFSDAHDGTNGGMRAILDIIADHLKTEGVEDYVRFVFEHHVAPNSWEDKVDLMRQFINRHGAILGSSIDAAHPERYAHDYRDVVDAFVQGMRRTSSVFRRM